MLLNIYLNANIQILNVIRASIIPKLEFPNFPNPKIGSYRISF